jgi:hypothetical protein
MLLLIHILVALAGIVAAAWAYLKPSASKLRISYELIGLTLISGTVLVISAHSNLHDACIAGLTYLAVTLSATALAHRKLANQTAE